MREPGIISVTCTHVVYQVRTDSIWKRMDLVSKEPLYLLTVVAFLVSTSQGWPPLCDHLIQHNHWMQNLFHLGAQSHIWQHYTTTQFASHWCQGEKLHQGQSKSLRGNWDPMVLCSSDPDKQMGFLAKARRKESTCFYCSWGQSNQEKFLVTQIGVGMSLLFRF